MGVGEFAGARATRAAVRLHHCHRRGGVAAASMATPGVRGPFPRAAEVPSLLSQHALVVRRRGVIPLGREGGVAFHSPHSCVVTLAMRGLAERPRSGLRAQLPSVGEDRRLRLRQRFLPGETGSLGSAPPAARRRLRALRGRGFTR